MWVDIGIGRIDYQNISVRNVRRYVLERMGGVFVREVWPDNATFADLMLKKR